MAYEGPHPFPVKSGGSGATTLTGVLIGNGTSAFTSNAVTQHDVLVGGASNAITSVAPSATSGVPLVSSGASADPAFGTAVVAGGGTGDTSFTAYSVITGGTTSTGALQNVSGVGTSGQVLTSNGAAALPTWQAAGGSGAAKAWGMISISNVGAVTLVTSFNVTSATNAWPTTITLTSGFSSSNYLVITTGTSGSQNAVPNYSIISSTQFTLELGAAFTGAGTLFQSFACFGT